MFAVLHGEYEQVRRMTLECCRVLKAGGVYAVISFGVPKMRLPRLEAEGLDWTVAVHKLAKPGMQVCTVGVW